MLAIAVKFTAILLLPFLLIAARARDRAGPDDRSARRWPRCRWSR